MGTIRIAILITIRFPFAILIAILVTVPIRVPSVAPPYFREVAQTATVL